VSSNPCCGSELGRGRLADELLEQLPSLQELDLLEELEQGQEGEGEQAVRSSMAEGAAAGSNADDAGGFEYPVWPRLMDELEPAQLAACSWRACFWGGRACNAAGGSGAA
jgi:hypothetical protein